MEDNCYWLYNKMDTYIESAGKNTDFNLDFLEGFVYALLLVQQDIKENINASKEKKKN